MPSLPLRRRHCFSLLAFAAGCSAGLFANLPVTIVVDAAQPQGALKPIYRFFGADEPNYSYMKDGRRLLREIGRLGEAPAYFRTHHLLVTGDGTPALKWGSTNAYTEDAAGRPIYPKFVSSRSAFFANQRLTGFRRRFSALHL